MGLITHFTITWGFSLRRGESQRPPNRAEAVHEVTVPEVKAW